MKLTDAEWKAMDVLWEMRRPATAREIRETLDPETKWTHSTTKTILSRLVAKGVLRTQMRTAMWVEVSVYEPLITREEAQRAEVRTLIDRAFDGLPIPLMHFLLSTERLTESQKAELKRLIDGREDEGE